MNPVIFWGIIIVVAICALDVTLGLIEKRMKKKEGTNK